MSHHGQNSWKKFQVVALKLMQCFTYLLLYKQFINGVPFYLKEYVKMLLYGPFKSVLKWVTCPHTPTSMPLQKQCRSLIKRLNKARSLINQVLIICSFQGLLNVTYIFSNVDTTAVYEQFAKDTLLALLECMHLILNIIHPEFCFADRVIHHTSHRPICLSYC